MIVLTRLDTLVHLSLFSPLSYIGIHYSALLGVVEAVGCQEKGKKEKQPVERDQRDI